MTRIAVVDTETTGIEPDPAILWEVGIIMADSETGADREYLWQYGPESSAHLNERSLAVGGYYERLSVGPGEVRAMSADAEALLSGGTRSDLSEALSGLLSRAVLVGVNPAFDAGHLRHFMGSERPVWDYHLEDVSSLIGGFLRGGGRQAPPLGSRSIVLYEALGLKVDPVEAHTALGDARVVRRALSLMSIPLLKR